MIKRDSLGRFIIPPSYKGGVATERIYGVWVGMKSRCLNPKKDNFKDYGGRGITICKRWLDSKNFIDDMKDTYREGLLLDRIDNNGDYSLENCRWVTPKESSNNRRIAKTVRKYVINGREVSLPELSRELGINVKTLWSRLNRSKWPIEKIVIQQKMRGLNGVTKPHWV